MRKAQESTDTAVQTTVRNVFILLLLILVIALILIGFGIIPVTKPPSISNAILGAILATISAYILYWQTKIQERQAEIEKTMLDYETKPIIEVVDKKFDSNSVTVSLTNYGNGVAVDLHLNCSITTFDVDWFDGINSQTPLKRARDGELLEDTSIRPQEEPATYSTKGITAGRRDAQGSEVHSSFETIMENLFDEDDADLSVRLWVTANPEVGEYSVEDEVCDEININTSTRVSQYDLQTIYGYQK